jgi:hypothetical protein
MRTAIPLLVSAALRRGKSGGTNVKLCECGASSGGSCPALSQRSRRCRYDPAGKAIVRDANRLAAFDVLRRLWPWRRRDPARVRCSSVSPSRKPGLLQTANQGAGAVILCRPHDLGPRREVQIDAGLPVEHLSDGFGKHPDTTGLNGKQRETPLNAGFRGLMERPYAEYVAILTQPCGEELYE